jgi:hypothetical protein
MDTVGESITNRQTKVLQLKAITTDSRFEPFVIRENTNMYYTPTVSAPIQGG